MNNLIASEPWPARQHLALSVCTHCPVRAECLADVDPQLDEGVRGGRVLEPIPRSRYTTAEVTAALEVVVSSKILSTRGAA